MSNVSLKVLSSEQVADILESGKVTETYELQGFRVRQVRNGDTVQLLIQGPGDQHALINC